MKYCVYLGVIYTVANENGSMLNLNGVLGNEVVYKDQVKEVPEEVYLQVKTEYESIVQELVNVTHRIYRLNEEYYKKHSVLREMRAEASRREKEVINTVLQQIDKR